MQKTKQPGFRPFLPLAKMAVRLGRALAGNMPLAYCIYMGSISLPAPLIRGPPTGSLDAATPGGIDYHFLPTGENHGVAAVKPAASNRPPDGCTEIGSIPLPAPPIRGPPTRGGPLIGGAEHAISEHEIVAVFCPETLNVSTILLPLSPSS